MLVSYDNLISMALNKKKDKRISYFIYMKTLTQVKRNLFN